MAKKEKESLPTFGDFYEEDLINDSTETEEEQDEDKEDEEKEEEEEKPKPKAKAEKAPKKEKEVKKVKEVPKEEVEEELEEEPEVKSKTETEEEEKTEDRPLEDDPDEAIKFFEEVEKLTGQELDIDYGDTDPLSPQGVALREIAVKEAALDGWLQEIEEKFPKVYMALKHANNGGDPAELFTQASGRDYSKVVLNEGDDALAKEILKDYYKARGVTSEAKIAKFIEADEESEGGLVKEAKVVLEELKADQAKKDKTVFDEQERKSQEDKKRDKILITAVDEVLDTKQLGGFKIADKGEAGQFREFVVKNIRKVGDGKYELATPMDSANLTKALQYQYFQFKNGDLSKIIQQKATTEVVGKLKLRLKAEQEGFKKNRTQEDKQEQALTLRSYNEE